jgi:hypothetical protein
MTNSRELSNEVLTKTNEEIISPNKVLNHSDINEVLENKDLKGKGKATESEEIAEVIEENSLEKNLYPFSQGETINKL